MSIGEKIKNARKKKKLTQKKLAELLNKSERTIQAYEGNKIVPPYDVLRNICSILNLNITSIFSEINYSNMGNYDQEQIKTLIDKGMQDQIDQIANGAIRAIPQEDINKEIINSLDLIYYYLDFNPNESYSKSIFLDIYNDNEFKDCLIYLKKKYIRRYKENKLNTFKGDGNNGN